MTSYMNACEYPFFACKILCSKNKKIKTKLFASGKNYLSKLINKALSISNNNLCDSTIPGYVQSIIHAHSGDENMTNSIEEDIEKLYINFIDKLEYDSFSDMLFNILIEGVLLEKNKFLNVVEKIIGLFLDLNNNLNISSSFNLCFLIVKLIRNSTKIFEMTVDNILKGDKLLSVIQEKEDKNLCTVYIRLLNNMLFAYILQKDGIFQSEGEEIGEDNITENFNYNLIDKYPSLCLHSIYEYETLEVLSPNYFTLKKEKEKNKIKKEYPISYCKEFFKFLDENLASIIFSFKLWKNTLFVLDMINLLLFIEEKERKNNKIDKDIMNNLESIKNKAKNDNGFYEFKKRMINLIIYNPLCSILHNKIIRMFEFIYGNKEENKPSKDNKDKISDILGLIENHFSRSQTQTLIDSNNRISNKSDNNIYLFRVYSLLSTENSPNSTGEGIKNYLNFIEKGLFEKEKASKSCEIKINSTEDEVMPVKTRDIRESEGFIFSSKKVIEKSKKISSRLKQLDPM